MKRLSLWLWGAAVLGLSSCDRTAPGAPPGGGPPRPSGSPAESLEPQHSPAPPAARPAGIRLTDITAESGLVHVHENGSRGDKLLPETLGSGAAWLDADRDGRLDVFLVSSRPLGRQRTPVEGPRSTCSLFRGNGAGKLADVTKESGAGIALAGMGAAAGDPDGDGDDDLLVTGVDRMVLLGNAGGVFHDATAEARLQAPSWTDSSGASHPAWTTAAVWLDIENDGDLDLLVGGYVEWSLETEIFTTVDGVNKAFTTPDRYRGLAPHLYLNQGAGTFVDGSEPAGLSALEGKTLGMALWDLDDDGLLDIFVANDTRPNFLLRNRGGGRLEEVGLAAGIAYDETGRARAGMGIDVADLEGNGLPTVFIGNFSDEPLSCFTLRKGEQTFTSEALRAGLEAATRRPLAFGVLGTDLDLDGYVDLLVANGHIEPDAARLFPGQTYAQPAQLFFGRSSGTFEDASQAVGSDLQVPRVGRGLAAGDVDGDGDLDLLLTTNGGPAVLLRNDRLAAAANHYLRVELRGRGGNPAGLGAHITLGAGGRSQTRLARTGSSYLSQSEGASTFGLGQATSVERLEVRWPTGKLQVVPVPGVDQTVIVTEEP